MSGYQHLGFLVPALKKLRDMKTTNVKVAWVDVCKPKQEGELGIRSLKVVNKVNCLKLIWRLLSAKSLWVQCIQNYLIRKNSFWSLKETSTTGSCMWKKILKARGMAKSFHKVDIRSGSTMSFWFDVWTDMGRLHGIIGDRGYIDMGITETTTVE